MLWLCGKEQTLTEVPHDARKSFSDLAPPLPSTTPCLLLFHTPHHKFAILCVGNSTTFEACLLQSNQDSYTSQGTTFTLQEYLAHNPTRMTYQELSDFIGDMQLAVSDRESCPSEECRQHRSVGDRQGYKLTRIVCTSTKRCHYDVVPFAAPAVQAGFGTSAV